VVELISTGGPPRAVQGTLHINSTTGQVTGILTGFLPGDVPIIFIQTTAGSMAVAQPAADLSGNVTVLGTVVGAPIQNSTVSVNVSGPFSPQTVATGTVVCASGPATEHPSCAGLRTARANAVREGNPTATATLASQMVALGCLP
jgi:hypothetical protein